MHELVRIPDSVKLGADKEIALLGLGAWSSGGSCRKLCYTRLDLTKGRSARITQPDEYFFGPPGP